MKNTLKWVIYGGLFVLPFIPFLVFSSFFFPFITSKAFAFRIIIEVIFAAWVILALLDQAYRPNKSVILYSLFIFLGIIGLANIFGAAPVKSFWSNFERMEGYVTLLHLGALFLVAGSFFQEIDWKRWWNTSLAASGLMVLYTMLQLLGSITINQGGARVDGTFGNASYLAVYMLFHFFLAVFFMWRTRKRITMRWVYGLLAFSHLFILYHTATRGAILGVLGGLVILALLNLRNKEEAGLRKVSMTVLLSLVVLVGGFWLAKDTNLVQGSPVLVRFAEISTKELQSGGRAFVWPMAVEGVKERPLLGWGQENFSYVFQKYYDPAMYHLEPWFDRAHNIFLDWAVAGGILGLLAYLSLYITLLYIVWKQDEGMSYAEKSIITALVAAYFFHNLFVFDHLISYILFFSLLAYVHSRSTDQVLWTKPVEERSVMNIALPVVLVLLVVTFYFLNLKPISANASLIDALKSRQLNEPGQAIENFKRAHERSRLGRPEVTEQIVTNSVPILESSLPIEKRNEYFSYVKGVVVELAQDFQDDARYQMMAGSFLTQIGSPDEALVHLKRAEELSPGKQAIKFEIAEVYISKKDYQKALEVARETFEMEPSYTNAQFTYAVAAIYAGDRTLENKLKDVIFASDAERENELEERGSERVDIESWSSSDMIVRAYLNVGRHSDAVGLLERRIERDPTNAQNYISLASVYLQMEDRVSAIQVIRKLAELFPEYKVQAEEYIRQIQEGRDI